MDKFAKFSWVLTILGLAVISQVEPDLYLPFAMIAFFPIPLAVSLTGMIEIMLYGNPFLTASLVGALHPLLMSHLLKPLDVCYWESLNLSLYVHGPIFYNACTYGGHLY
jgi:hypothetical protein